MKGILRCEFTKLDGAKEIRVLRFSYDYQDYLRMDGQDLDRLIKSIVSQSRYMDIKNNYRRRKTLIFNVSNRSYYTKEVNL